MIYTEKIQRAIKFAAKTHNHYQQQLRKGKVLPYVMHPLTVGIILTKAGAKEDVVVAGILHDTIEDSIQEKKVTVEMLSERFGQDVAMLVLSVTEQDKKLSWDERKAQAIEHIKHFSVDSVLIKSADVISNVSELIDDYAREGEEVFSRFSASREKTINNQLNVMAAILKKWPESPLAEDIAYFREKLQKI